MTRRLTPTSDGTLSVFSDEYGQAMHSLSGAYEEALLKHVFPSKILERDAPVLRVLDVGFGIGYNVLALLDEFLKDMKGRSVEVISLEKDLTLTGMMHDIRFPGERGALYESLKDLPEKSVIAGDGYSVRLIAGDARRSVKELPSSSFHAVFHDAFSPSKNPELWSADFFREIYRVGADGCVLTTYSSAPQVRGALLEAGFTIGRGPSVGKKREGTLAAKGDITQPLGNGELEEIRNNVKSTPYRDPGLAAMRDAILARRLEEMKIRRGVVRRGLPAPG